ncbi:MAG TPA: hypothetical protein VG223_18460 [Solirubrobacteraceae bacterium]|nr:hypothetical protein [Solirubrobacteraceae bacterium]
MRTDQSYHASPSGQFGARAITARGASCTAARRLAAAYVEDPYSVYDRRDSTKPLDGWTCTWRTDRQVAQRVAVGCVRGTRRIHFADRLPSG